MRPLHRLALVALLLHPALAAPAAARGRVAAGVFAGDPARAGSELPPDLVHAGDVDEGELLLLVLDAPADEAWWAEAVAAGVVVHEYLPEHAFVIEAPRGARGGLRQLPGVADLGPFHAGYKLRDGALGGPFGDDVRLVVRRAGRGRVEHELLPGPAAHPDRVLGRAREGRVLSVTVEPLPRPHNDAARWVTQSGRPGSLPLFDRGLTGAGEIVAVCDSGVNVGCFHSDPAQAVAYQSVDPARPPAAPLTSPGHRKLQAYQYWAASDRVDAGVHHGTHVAGTIAGDQGTWATTSTPGSDPADGLAPGARLVVQDVDADAGWLEVPTELAGFVQAAYNAGARIHTNSWGTDSNEYLSLSQEMDLAMWNNPELLVLVAAGNAGPRPGTVGAPATAKNVLAVGASGSGSGAGSLASFSSNGPCADGRRKPDLVAPGVSLGSADGASACGTKAMSGTSMATPAVAGSAALVRSYFRRGFYPSGTERPEDARTPSGALVKALLVASGVDLAGGASVDAPVPDMSQGWGRVRLESVLAFAGGARDLLVLADDDVSASSDGFPSGATAAERFSFPVSDPAEPLRVALAWTDRPGSPSAGSAGVNDLDLLVRAPDGSEYRGNVFSGGASVAGGSFDRRNNLEQVWLRAGAAAAGEWTVEVRPAAVNLGRQPFALVVVGGLGAAAPCSASPTFAGLAAATDADACAATGVRLEWSAPAAWGCGSAATGRLEIHRDGALLAATADGAVTTWTDATAVAGVAHRYAVTAVKEAGGRAGAGVERTATDAAAAPPPPSLRAVRSGAGAVLAWSAVPGAALSEVRRAADAASLADPARAVATVAGTSWTDAAPAGATLLFYSVESRCR